MPTGPGAIFDPTADPLPDLRLTAIEITQGIQDLASRMPLVANRRTWIRLHVATGSPGADIGSVAGGEIPPAPSGPLADVDGAILLERGSQATVIYPENAPIQAVPLPDRADPNSALNFLIPPEWDDPGEVTFTAVAWSPTPAGIDNEPDSDNNFATGSRTFQEGTEPELIVVPLNPGSTGAAPSNAEMEIAGQLVVDSLLQFHPLADPVVYRLWQHLLPGPEADDPETDEVETDWDLTESDGDPARRDDPNIRMGEIHALWDLPGSTRFLGIFDNSVPTGGFTGWSKSKYYSAWSKPDINTAAHELGHQRGLAHVPCDDEDGNNQPDEPAGGAVDPTFPEDFSFPTCSLAPVDPTGYYAFANYFDFPEVYSNDPSHSSIRYPLMSYKGPQWIDPYHYCKLLDSYGINCDPESIGLDPRTPPWGSVNCFPANQGGIQLDLCVQGDQLDPDPIELPDQSQVQVAIPTGVDSYALVKATLDPDAASRGSIFPFYTTDRPARALLDEFEKAILDVKAGAPSEADLAVYDAGGGLLAKVPVSLDGAGHGDGAQQIGLVGAFELVPWPDGAARIELVYKGQPAAARSVSENAPVLEVGSPEVDAGRRTVDLSWNMSDPDGDDLFPIVEWSNDGGDTWHPIVIGSLYNPPDSPPDSTQAQTHAFTLQDPALPGGDVVLRLRVTDGARTVSQTTESFELPEAPPRVTISVEQDFRADGGGFEVALNGRATLLAHAVDPEDGVLAGDAIVWESDLDGELGTGRTVETRTLSQGSHTISVIATDSSGETATETVTLEVTDQGVPARRPLGDVPEAEARLLELAGLDSDALSTPDDDSNTAVIVGAALGGLAVIGIGGALWRRRRAG